MINLSKIRKTKEKYADISKLYNISGIYDTYICIKESNKKKYIHIYNIKPVVILNSSKIDMQKIIQNYSEFLRSVNYNFQIFIENEEININSYFSNINIEENSNKKSIIEVYKKEFEKLLVKNSIYVSNYYIIVSLYEKESEAELNHLINNLNETGVTVEKLMKEEILEKFIYSKINMEKGIC